MKLLFHIFSILLLRLNSICEASNENNPNAPDIISYKTNLCDRQYQVMIGEMSIENSLKGMNITAALAGDGKKETIWKIMMDEVAQRAGFSVAYNVTGGVEGYETYTQKLYEESFVYDVAVDWWTRRLHRLNMGILFPENWWDGDTIMVVNSDKKGSYSSSNLFVFAKPFTTSLWVTMISTALITGVVYFLLDYLRSKRHKDSDIDANLKRSMFLSMNAFVGHSAFDPKGTSTRVLTFSMNFLYLILIAAYTANLASILVIRNSVHTEIKEFNDVLKNSRQICVQRGVAYVDSVAKKYPWSKNLMIEYETMEEMFSGLSNGDCYVLLTSMEDWKTSERQRKFNKDCDMLWVGRHVETVPASFALRKSMGLCTSLLSDVLDYYLIKMKSDGAIEEIWENYRNVHLNNTCSASDGSSTDDDERKLQLGISDLAGMFLFHAFIVCVAVLFELFLFCSCVSNKEEIVKNDVIRMKRSSRILFQSSHRNSISIPPEASLQSIANTPILSEEITVNAAMSEDFHSVNVLPLIIDNLEDIVFQNSDMIIVKKKRD